MGASAPRGRDAGLPNLLADVLRGESIEPELLLRYADDPASLRAEERERVEAGLRESPRLRDQLRVLRGFDLAAAVGEPVAVPAPRPEPRRPSLFARLAELLRGRVGMVLVPLGAAAVLALVLLRQGEAPLLTPTPGSAPPGPVARVEPPEERVTPAPVPQTPPPAPAPRVTREPEPRAEPARPKPAPSAVARAPEPPPSPAAEEAPPAQELDYVAMAEPVYTKPFGAVDLDASQTYVRAPSAGISLYALVPAHVARTISPAPVLYWSLSALPPGGTTVLLTIASDDASQPLLEKTLPTPTSAGVQRTALADFGAQLPVGTALRWSIAVRLDPENPSKDVLASGGIERIAEPADLAAKLAAAKPLDRASVYAAAGIWYEALAELEGVVRTAPGQASPRKHLRAMLENAGVRSSNLP